MRSATVRDDFHNQLLAEEPVCRQGRKPHGGGQVGQRAGNQFGEARFSRGQKKFPESRQKL